MGEDDNIYLYVNYSFCAENLIQVSNMFIPPLCNAWEFTGQNLELLKSMSFIDVFNGLQNSSTKKLMDRHRKLYNIILKGTLPCHKATFFWNIYHTYRIHISVLSTCHLLSFGEAA